MQRFGPWDIWTIHPLTMHICAIQSVHKRPTHRTRLAQELQCHLCAPKQVLSSGVAHISPFVAFSPAVHHEPPHLPDTLFLLPRHQNTQHIRDNMIYSKNTEYIMHISCSPKQHQQESLWRENLQSGGNPRRTTPTCYDPKELATVSRK